MTRDIVELRIGITCARCGENRVRVVHVAPTQREHSSVYYVNGDAYRVCQECEHATANDAHSIRANAESRRANDGSLGQLNRTSWLEDKYTDNPSS